MAHHYKQMMLTDFTHFVDMQSNLLYKRFSLGRLVIIENQSIGTVFIATHKLSK